MGKFHLYRPLYLALLFLSFTLPHTMPISLPWVILRHDGAFYPRAFPRSGIRRGLCLL